jgi:hypothetical protein
MSESEPSNNHQKSQTETGYLLEQYKLYVEMADRVTERRLKINSFYLSILTGLLIFSALPSFVKEGSLTNPGRQLVALTSLTGMIICILWWIGLASLKKLNSLKFKVINDMENSLPYQCFQKEWDDNDEEISAIIKEYRKLRKSESLVPIVISIPYFIFFIFNIGTLFK